MEIIQSICFIWILLPILRSTAWDCLGSNPPTVAHTITVDNSGHGNFTTIQSAIDWIPEMNNQWIHIQISASIYREKVLIPVSKPCIFLEGAGLQSTFVEWGDHGQTDVSATFTSFADNIVATGIAFRNTYSEVTNKRENNTYLEESYWSKGRIVLEQAVAARITGDRTAFYRCAFLGVQDTFWDQTGRHYLKECYFEGAVDFIFGAAQSLYERCKLSVNIEKYYPGVPGFITAQNKQEAHQASAFVFKTCAIVGPGKAALGRAWGPYSTVIIYNCFMSDVVSPEGWDAWDYVQHERNFTYVEAQNRGPGSDTSKRVPWMKNLNHRQILNYVQTSFVDPEGWLNRMPIKLTED